MSLDELGWYYQFGRYEYWGAGSFDEIAYNAPYYLIVQAAGNDRDDVHNGMHYALNSQKKSYENYD